MDPGPRPNKSAMRHNPPSRPLTGCACDIVCGGGSSSGGRCVEAISACADDIPHTNGPYNLAVLQDNQVYRIKDVLGQRANWRLLSIRILCEPRYRLTLLRKTLVATSLLDGVPMARLSDGAMEAALRSRSESEVAPGHAQLTGHVGPNNITLAEPKTLFHTFARVLKESYHSKPCEVAAADELVVAMRLGDEAPSSGAKGWKLKIDKHIKAHKVYPVRKLVVSAALQYVGSGPQQINRHTVEKDAIGIQIVDDLCTWAREKRNLSVRLRSQPVADDDVCYYVFSRHVLGVSRAHKYTLKGRWADVTGLRNTNSSTNGTVGLYPGPGRPGLISIAEPLRVVIDPYVKWRHTLTAQRAELRRLKW